MIHFKKIFLVTSIFVSLIIVLVTLFMSSFATANSSEIMIKINGEKVAFTDAHPYLDDNNRTMVPVRFVSEALGAEVFWERETAKTVTVINEDIQIKLKVDSDIINVNDVENQMDTRMVYNEEQERNYVPLRFVSENLGSTVDWSREEGILYVYITDGTDGEAPIDQPSLDSNNKIYEIAIGDNQANLLNILGEPDRKDLSAYGHTWWIYNQDFENYLQVGVHDNKVVNIYSNSNHWDFKGLRTGMAIDEANDLFPIMEELTMEHDGATYTISQNSESPIGKYLAFDADLALQIYIDIHDNDKVTAIRVSEPTYILASGSYRLNWSFSGNQPNHHPPVLTEAEQQSVDRGNELQMIDLVNAVRVRMDLDRLDWHGDIADVAYGHSVDMRSNQFFSHTSPTAGTVSDRVERAGILYSRVGENIAAGQADAIEAHEGLMNSYGHRVNILNPDYSALGTGVYYKHFTQKFIFPR